MRSENHPIQPNSSGGRRKLADTLPVLAFAIAGFLFLGACSSGPGGIRNGGKLDVKYYHLNPGERVETQDPMIAFERQHYMHGAISASDQEARFGHYFSVHWKVDDRSGPIVVRFEYKQTNTGLEARVQEQVYDVVKKRNRTEFRVVGEEYFTGGEVTSFRFSLLRGDEVLATDESFAWED